MAQFFVETSWWVPCYGLLGALVSIPWSIGWIRLSGPRPAAYLNIFTTLIALLHGLLLLAQIWGQPPQELFVPWLDAQELHLTLALSISPLTVGATVLISGLSFLAQIFALGYMEKDWGLARFYALMGFFEAAMTGIALSDSLLLSYALLEMLTLSTYLLVGFWYAQPLVVKAARDAFLTKRIGDLFLFMGVVALTTLSGHINFSDLNRWAYGADLQPWVATLLGLSLIAGPIGKCAQFPLHLWLDEAMEGPNPASILRNSVVVACGAFVLIKLQPILSLSSVVTGALIAIGSITAVGASLMAIAQIDLKRALSHTTSAYLGLVFMAVGLGHSDVALELLLTHALAKGLLFMGVGSIILTVISQDLTELGGLRSRMPATTLAFWVGSLAMLGILPLGGFWAMLRLAETLQAGDTALLMLVLLAVNALTALNLVRVYGRIFEGKVQPKTRRAPEVAWLMAVPIVIMVVLNVLAPWMLSQWQLIPNPTDPRLVAGLVGSGLLGLGAGWFYVSNPTVSAWIRIRLTWVQNFLAYDFYIEKLYNVLVVIPFGALSQLSNWLDRFWVDGVVNGMALAFLVGGEGFKYTASGRLQAYILTILVGVMVALCWAVMSWFPIG